MVTTSLSPLQQTAAIRATDFWNDSCSIQELTYAIANGAVALRHGIFCELGQGCVDFPKVLSWLKNEGYDGFVLVEQDVLPGVGTPRESAKRNREYLRSIERHYE